MNRHDLIRVLGPIDLLSPSGPRSVGTPSSRRLLGVLVVGAGRAIPADQLIWALWGDAPPRSARSSLQSYVSRLRKVLGPGAIGRADHSYWLAVGRDQIDALRFEDLLTDATVADGERRLALCRAALGLWRGEPFGELIDDEPFRLEAMRLEELRITAMELALETELAVGHPEIVVAELENAVREHPYRERLWHLLIEALRRDDRRVEALRICQEFRKVLATAGLTPSADLCAIEGSILEGGPIESGATR
ncbi:MAG TPA: BTAD domain-containing putative transcriptional regulator [Ilumatobacter sp.]